MQTRYGSMILGELPSQLVSARLLDTKRPTHFRLVEESDAEFICELRSNPLLNQHLSASPENPERQKLWIRNYKKREAIGTEFYFKIVTKNKSYGFVRIYDFKLSGCRNSFSWGSWILHPSRPDGLAVYTALGIYEIGFDVLGFDHCHFDVRQKNEKVVDFHKRTGAEIVKSDDTDHYFSYLPEAFMIFRQQSADHIAKFEGYA